MDKYTQFLEDAKASGEIPDSWLQRIQDTYEASGLRNEVRSERERADNLQTSLRTLQTSLLTDKFKEMGIPGKPSAYSLPDDIDPTNVESIQTWAVDQGLIQPVTTTPPAERAAHDRIANASTDGPTPTISLDDLDPTKLSEDEFYRRAEALQQQRTR